MGLSSQSSLTFEACIINSEHTLHHKCTVPWPLRIFFSDYTYLERLFALRPEGPKNGGRIAESGVHAVFVDGQRVPSPPSRVPKRVFTL